MNLQNLIRQLKFETKWEDYLRKKELEFSGWDLGERDRTVYLKNKIDFLEIPECQHAWGKYTDYYKKCTKCETIEYDDYKAYCTIAKEVLGIKPCSHDYTRNVFGEYVCVKCWNMK